MAIRDDIKEQWRRQKDKPLRERMAYFARYYLLWVIVIAAIAAFAIFLVVNFVTKKPVAFTAEFVNADAETEEKLTQEIAKRSDIDTKKSAIDINMSRKLTPGKAVTQEDIGTQTAINAEIMDTSLDAMVVDAWNFNYYTELATFKDLRKVLSDDELDRYKDDIYYVDLTEVKKIQKEMDQPDYDGSAIEEDQTEALEKESYEKFVKPDPDKMDDPVPVGIILSDSPYIKKHGLYRYSVPVFGFVNNSSHVSVSEQLLDILTEDK